MNAKLVVCVLVALAVSGSCQTIRFKVSCRGLTSSDLLWGSPDPAARINYAFGSNDFTRVAETATLHTNNPAWADEFSFQFVAELSQRVQVEIVEKDALFDDTYGTVTFNMADIIGSGTLERDLNGKGTLVVSYY